MAVTDYVASVVAAYAGIEVVDDPVDAIARQGQLVTVLLVIAATDGTIDDARVAAAAVLGDADRLTLGAVFGRLRTRQSPDAELAKRFAAALLSDLTPVD